jgi:hypothetical protein
VRGLGGKFGLDVKARARVRGERDHSGCVCVNTKMNTHRALTTLRTRTRPRTRPRTFKDKTKDKAKDTTKVVDKTRHYGVCIPNPKKRHG